MSEEMSEGNPEHASDPRGDRPPSRTIDPSELWEIHGKYYDLTPFLDKHPGGKRMLELARGKDCTELFASVHLYDRRPAAMLARYYVADKPGHAESFSWKKEGFYETLRARVQELFRAEALERGMTRSFETKIAHGRSWFFVRLAILMTLSVALWIGGVLHGNIWCALLWGPVGFALGGYGHEALHGGVFATPWKNRLLALFSMDIHGISSYMYSHVHVTSHHIHPNIERVDPDIEIHYPMIREFLYQERRWFHRFQHLYAWPLYAISLVPANALDLIAIVTKKWGNLPVRRPYRTEMILFWGFKLLSIAYIYAAPYLVLGFQRGLLINLAMVLPASFLINATFALNHQNMQAMQQMEAGARPERLRSLERDASFDWGELQVRTGCDYQHGHWFTDMIFSGLGYQIEHHLFPLISYSQLHKVAPIVRRTCEEFGLPYYYFDSYWGALAAHHRFLKWMGSKASVPEASPATQDRSSEQGEASTVLEASP